MTSAVVTMACWAEQLCTSTTTSSPLQRELPSDRPDLENAAPPQWQASLVQRSFAPQLRSS
jgi:hypothetical protein